MFTGFLTVSVPSRGAIFLNLYVLSLYQRESVKVFPSPLGELYFLIIKTVEAVDEAKVVSVPSRGAIFLNDPETRN